MTATERVRSTQRSLGLVVGASAIFWGAAALFTALIVGALLAAFVGLPRGLRYALPYIAGLIGLATTGLLLYRGRFAWSFERVALWIEEHVPELRYALVTAIDPRYKDTSTGALMDPLVAKVDTGPFVRRAASRTLVPGLVALLVMGLGFAFMPRSIKDPVGAGGFMDLGPGAKRIVGNRLTALQATLTPPAYANMRAQTMNEPSTITGLRGSQVVISGEGPVEGLVAEIQSTDSSPHRPIQVTGDGNQWSIALTLSDSLPSALRITDEHPSRPQKYTRLIVLDPRMDQIPVLKLTLPVRDTTLRVIAGNLVLDATLNDDIGLGRAEFEYIITKTSEGEDDAKAEVHTIGARQMGGAKSGRLQLTIPLNSVGLSEGAMLSVRAQAWDTNTLYGPGKGVSETRTIRIATKGEYDTINVNAAPPSADTALLTLRMLIMATEQLHKSKASLDRRKYIDSSYALAGQARNIRQKIQRIIEQQTGNGEIAVDPLLKTANDAMYEAINSFMIAELGEVLPQLWIAYEALKKYSDTKRMYLRGLLRIEPVNIERVRLAGIDTGKTQPRKARPVTGKDKERLMNEYMRAMQLYQIAPDSAVETLTLMRVETLRNYPDVADALGQAVTNIQAKKDPSAPLAHARRAISGEAGVLRKLPVWSGAW